jgi:hypothetical protein
VAEERGLVIDDDQVNEEDRYVLGVTRIVGFAFIGMELSYGNPGHIYHHSSVNRLRLRRQVELLLQD